MKKNIVSFILGALIFGTIGVYAAGGTLIEVFYNVDNIVIDGASKMPEEKPFVYKGSTYVPLRFISENLGKEVKWDGKTKTVYIGGIDKDKVAYPGYNIEPITTQYKEPWMNIKYKYKDEQIKDNVGNKYDSYINFSGTYFDGNGYIEFPTNGEYKKLKGTVGITEVHKDTKFTMNFKVYADNELMYSEIIKAGDSPKEINVDISNALKVKIEVGASGESDLGSYGIGLFNPMFEK